MAENTSAPLEEEISALKTQYGEQCCISKRVGNFKHVIDLKPEDFDLRIKFQLPDNYPNVAPDILIESKCAVPFDVKDFQASLDSKAKEYLGKSMIENLYKASRMWLNEHGVVSDSNKNLNIRSMKSKTPLKKKGKRLDENCMGNYAEGDDDSSDDEVVNHLGEEEDVLNGDYAHANGASPAKAKAKPNHIICIRVTDPEIHEAVIAMQEAILEVEPGYAECCIPPPALHIILCNLSLDTEEQKAASHRVLHKHQKDLSALARQGLVATLEGVDSFFKQVLHVKVQPNKEFLDFVNQLRFLLGEENIAVHNIVPHMPILKATRPLPHLMKSDKFDIDLFGGFEDLDFGDQKVDEIHLCSLTGEQSEGGFYASLTSVPL